MDHLNLHHEIFEMPSPAQNLVLLIKQLIKEEQYEGVALLFTGESEAARNIRLVPEICMELFRDVCLKHLNDETYNGNAELYECAAETLKLLAVYGPAEELLLELLEMIEEQKSENVFTSVLRAMQKVLLRLGDEKPRALEWSLNSIQTHLEELPLPEYLMEGYDKKQEGLLELNKHVQSLLMHYITVGLFYEPILKECLEKERPKDAIFRDCGLNRRNVLCCFLVNLLGQPLALLDLATHENKTNTYTLQCARNITGAVSQCVGDPLYLLGFVEERIRWRTRKQETQEDDSMSCNNIFLMKEKLPLEGVAIYYYQLFVEGVGLEFIPKVYSPLYIFETGLYLANELLCYQEPPLQCRGVMLAKGLVQQLQQTLVPINSLQLEIHRKFCHALCQLIGYSAQAELRQDGVLVLRQYILQFEDEAKYLILKNLLRSVSHNGIAGYLVIFYKDLVAEALAASSDDELPLPYSGQHFQSMFLQNICHLPQGIETDFLEYSDKVISSLNAVRFFAIKDCKNLTGFWSFIGDVHRNFLDPLRSGLDISFAHYKSELLMIEDGTSEAAAREKLKLVDVCVTNPAIADGEEKVDLEMDREQKMKILNQNLCTFELMRSLLARTTECVEHAAKLLPV